MTGVAHVRHLFRAEPNDWATGDWAHRRARCLAGLSVCERRSEQRERAKVDVGVLREFLLFNVDVLC